jgi:hypothetical protein
MLSLPTMEDTIADRTIRLAITLARTTTAVIPATVARGTVTIDPVGTATDGRATTGQAGMVTGLRVRSVVFCGISPASHATPDDRDARSGVITSRFCPAIRAWSRRCFAFSVFLGRASPDRAGARPYRVQLRITSRFAHDPGLPLLSHFNQLHQRVDSYLFERYASSIGKRG